MKKGLLISALAATALLSGGVQANEEIQPIPKAKEHNCVACHAVSKKIVGPSYKEIAAKYKAEDLTALMDKVKKGGSGAFGPIPMPPNPKVSDDDLKTLVTWILSLK
jgi:cytochrome c